jgi:hypothetical protein
MNISSNNKSTLFAIDKINKKDESTKNFRFKIVKRRCLWTREVKIII